MKTTQLLSMLLGSIIVFNTACSNKENEEHNQKSEVANQVNVDSLEKAWDEAWADGNVNKISEMLDEDAMVFENEWMVRGKDSLIKKFVEPNTSVIKSFATTKIINGVSEGVAYCVGRYKITLKDTASAGPEGPFTIIWKKHSSGQWKVGVLQTGTDKK